MHDVELDANGSKVDCTALAPVEQGLPAHSAPLGLSFTRRALPGVGSGALVGVHGSWNRIPPREPSTSATTSPTRYRVARRRARTAHVGPSGHRRPGGRRG